MKANILIVSIALMIAVGSADDGPVPVLGTLKSSIITGAIHNQQNTIVPQPNPAVQDQTSQTGESVYPMNGYIDNGAKLGPVSGPVSGALLNLPGVIGDVIGEGHSGWINILAFNFSIKGSRYTAGYWEDSEPEHPELSDLVLVKQMDQSSPVIYQLACSGRLLNDNVNLEIIQDGMVVMIYTLSDVVISNVQVIGADLGNGQKPLEVISLSYGKITWKYGSADKTGKATNPIEAGWNLFGNNAS
jgi:type VI secretion system secreted protein Hcp